MTPLKIGDRVKILSSTRFHPNRAGIGQTGEVRRLETKEMVIVDCADGAQRRYMRSGLALAPAAPEVAGGGADDVPVLPWKCVFPECACKRPPVESVSPPAPVAAAAPGVTREELRSLTLDLRKMIGTARCAENPWGSPELAEAIMSHITANFHLTPKG